MNKIGIFGGTFDPIHNGHIKVAQEILEYLNLNKIIFIPTNIPPHKVKLGNTTNFQRLKMCELATKNNPIFCVSHIEILREGKSYTADTIDKLRKIYLGDELFLIVGADMFVTLLNWANPLKIFSMVTICTVPRGEFTYERLKLYEKKLNAVKAKTVVLKLPFIDVSSTEIRNKIKKGESVSSLVPQKVNDYILKNKIYS